MGKINDIDRRVLAAMGGRDRLKLLLKDAGFTMQEFAGKHGLWAEQVSMCLSGDRPYPEVRAALAKELSLPVEAVDELIDGEKAA